MREDNFENGQEVTLEYVPVNSMSRSGRQSEQITIEKVTGNIVYFEPDEEIDVQLILDPENDVWARCTKTGKDGHFGRIASIE